MKKVPVACLVIAVSAALTAPSFAKSKRHHHHHSQHHSQQMRHMPHAGAYGYYRQRNGEGWAQSGFSSSFGNNSRGTRSPGVPGDLGNR